MRAPVPVILALGAASAVALSALSFQAGPAIGSVHNSSPPTGSVTISGAVTLSEATVSSLAEPACTIGVPQVVELTITPTATPSTPMVERTQITVINLETNREVWCREDTGGVDPDATNAHVLLPNGGFRTLPLRDGSTLKCRSELATARINIEEASCAQ